MTNDIKLNLINIISRFILAFVFLYHGIVPKILWLDSTEILLIELHNLSFKTEHVAMLGGAFEIVLAVLVIFYKKSLLPIYTTIILFIVLLIDVSIIQPNLLIKAFNPLTMNVMSISLGVIIILSDRNKEIL